MYLGIATFEQTFPLSAFAALSKLSVPALYRTSPSLLNPRHLQHFINSNFALLPSASDKATSILLRLLGAFALWYGYTLFSLFRQELSALGFG